MSRPVFTAIGLAMSAYALAASPLSAQQPSGRPADGAAASPEFSRSLLESHNQARAARGSQPLVWNSELATAAEDFAIVLANLNVLEHSPREVRNGAGENLWKGTTGLYNTRDMMNGFLQEEQAYRSGVFPDVSTSGNWLDVSHYTQIIWPGTKEVGCALATNGENDFLVCRYLPAGNRFGVQLP